MHRRQLLQTLLATAAVGLPSVSRVATASVLDLQASLAQLPPHAAWQPSLAADRITLSELLTHTHGIYADAVPAQLRVNFSGVYRDNAELVRWLAQATPAARGKAFEYANLGYDLAATAMAPAGRAWAVSTVPAASFRSCRHGVWASPC